MKGLLMIIPAGCSDLPRRHAVGEGDESRRDALPNGSAGCRRRGPRPAGLLSTAARPALHRASSSSASSASSALWGMRWRWLGGGTGTFRSKRQQPEFGRIDPTGLSPTENFDSNSGGGGARSLRRRCRRRSHRRRPHQPPLTGAMPRIWPT